MLFRSAFMAKSYSGMVALHGDLSNYYFQIPIPQSQYHNHCFLVNKELYAWKVLTMGFFKATSIAEALCIHLVLSGGPESEFSDSPNGLIHLSTGGLVVVIYDSFLLIERPSIVAEYKKRIVENCTIAKAKLKYIQVSNLEEPFEYCGFTLV